MDKKKMDNDKLKDLLMELSECGGNSYSASDEYNIFEVLGVENKEVIMCRFIGDLLDCKGKHGLGSEPLRLFIQDVLGDKDFGDNLDESNIVLEDSTYNGRRVDIAIYLNNKIYPIEVKIWAGDQNEQLVDYYRSYFHNRNDAKIYYLTPDGHSPSEKSKKSKKGSLEDWQIVRISFTKEIKEWLTEVCKIESASESIKSVIRSFMGVIDKMAQSENELSNIKEKLKLNDEAYNGEAIDGAILLLKHHDEIWDTIRRNYIRQILDCGNDYVLEDYNENDNDNDKDVPQHTLLRVKKNGNVVAWICVDKNLYIVAMKEGKDVDSWKTFDDDRLWKHIKKGKKNIQLNVPTVLKDVKEKQKIEYLLKGRGSQTAF